MTRHHYEELFTLQGLGIALGLLLVAMHLCALLQPERTQAFLKSLPRHKTIGLVLMAVNFLWWFWIIATVDLGEFYTVRGFLLTSLPVMFVLVVLFVDEFLAARALGFFVLLLACPLLDVAFQKPPTGRILIPIICYVWIVMALFWVGMPYLLRDQIAWVTASAKRWRGMAAAGLVYGGAVLVCALVFWKGYSSIAGMGDPGCGKILVIRGGAIGDFVLTLPALKLIRDTLPAARVEVLGYPPMIDLALLAGYADSVRSIEYAAMAGFFAPGSKLDGALQAYFSSFSVVVSYLFDPDGYFRGNLERAGVKTIVECPYRIDESGAHAARQLAAPLEGLAMYLEGGAAVIRPAGSGDAVVRDVLAWHPGSGSPAKNWQPRKWVEVLLRLGVGEVMLVTGEAEEERLAEIEALLREAGLAYVLAHGLGFGELVAKLRGVRLFFGHDSGISHLAAACGAPCVLVFGPTNPDIWAPLNEGVEVVAAPGADLALLEPEEVVALVQSRALL